MSYRQRDLEYENNELRRELAVLKGETSASPPPCRACKHMRYYYNGSWCHGPPADRYRDPVTGNGRMRCGDYRNLHVRCPYFVRGSRWRRFVTWFHFWDWAD